MTLTFAFLLMIVEAMITFYLMYKIMEWVNTRKSLAMQVRLNRFFNSSVIAFIINFMISVILGKFTGSSIVAGFANLASSIIVAVAIPKMIERKFNVSALEHEYNLQRESRRKKQNRTTRRQVYAENT